MHSDSLFRQLFDKLVSQFDLDSMDLHEYLMASVIPIAQQSLKETVAAPNLLPQLVYPAKDLIFKLLENYQDELTQRLRSKTLRANTHDTGASIFQEVSAAYPIPDDAFNHLIAYGYALAIAIYAIQFWCLELAKRSNHPEQAMLTKQWRCFTKTFSQTMIDHCHDSRKFSRAISILDDYTECVHFFLQQAQQIPPLLARQSPKLFAASNQKLLHQALSDLIFHLALYLNVNQAFCTKPQPVNSFDYRPNTEFSMHQALHLIAQQKFYTDDIVYSILSGAFPNAKIFAPAHPFSDKICKNNFIKQLAEALTTEQVCYLPIHLKPITNCWVGIAVVNDGNKPRLIIKDARGNGSSNPLNHFNHQQNGAEHHNYAKHRDTSKSLFAMIDAALRIAQQHQPELSVDVTEIATIHSSDLTLSGIYMTQFYYDIAQGQDITNKNRSLDACLENNLAYYREYKRDTLAWEAFKPIFQ